MSVIQQEPSSFTPRHVLCSPWNGADCKWGMKLSLCHQFIYAHCLWKKIFPWKMDRARFYTEVIWKKSLTITLAWGKGECNNLPGSQVARSASIQQQKKGESPRTRREKRNRLWGYSSQRQTYCEGFQQKNNRRRQGIQMHTHSAPLL